MKHSAVQSISLCNDACSRDISGGYSDGVPPLPIPNREVKPDRADGTAHPRESRSPPFYESPEFNRNSGLFYVSILADFYSLHAILFRKTSKGRPQLEGIYLFEQLH